MFAERRSFQGVTAEFARHPVPYACRGETHEFHETRFHTRDTGTPRQGRMSEHVARFVLEEVHKREDIANELIDVRK
jgi:hypothetical protein